MSDRTLIAPGNALPAAPATPVQADNDDTLIDLWLHGKAAHTRRAYAGDVQEFLAQVGKPLRQVTLGDVQAFAGSLEHLAPASRARKLGTMKSLLSFAHRLGYVTFNTAAAVRVPPVKQTLAERIMDECSVHRLLALETNPRNHALLRLLYIAGLRISEVCGLSWRDLQPREDGGQVVVFGKAGRTRTVLLPAPIWRELAELRGGADADDPVFRSREGGHLDPASVHRVVKAACARAGLSAEVSAHWLRHAHASHALDRGAPIHLVQATLGHASVATTGRYLHARPSDSSSRYLAA